MNSKKPNALLKGSLQVIILQLLQKRGRMYGYELTQVVKELTHGEVVLTEGALYPALHKMEKAGWLTTEVQIVENRARKYYDLTSGGASELKVKLKETRHVLESLNLLLHLKPSML